MLVALAKAMNDPVGGAPPKKKFKTRPAERSVIAAKEDDDAWAEKFPEMAARNAAHEQRREEARVSMEVNFIPGFVSRCGGTHVEDVSPWCDAR